MFLDYTSDVVERLAHVRAHVENEPLLDKLIANINADVPHKNACLLLLSGHVLGKSMVAWFADHNIVEFKNWLFTAAEIDRLAYQAEIDTLAPGGEFLQLFRPLVSDNTDLINWFSQYDLAYDLNRIEDPRAEDFFAYQAVLALKGDWTLLSDRCGKVAANSSPGRVEKKYGIDNQFYKALAMHDIPGMRSVINQLLTPKFLLKRRNFEDVNPGVNGANSEGSASFPGLDQAAIGMQWGKGIKGQGLPYEDYAASILPADTRLPTNFKTFDFFDK